MPETQGVVGLNTILNVSSVESPPDYDLVGEVGDISHGGETVEFAEFTHMQSTGGYREYKPTFKNAGEYTFSFNWTSDAGQAALKTAYDGSLPMLFQIQFPNAMEQTFTAYVSSIGPNAPMNGPLRKNVTLRITGAIDEHTYSPA